MNINLDDYKDAAWVNLRAENAAEWHQLLAIEKMLLEASVDCYSTICSDDTKYIKLVVYTRKRAGQ